jgi:hypothetical protein
MAAARLTALLRLSAVRSTSTARWNTWQQPARNMGIFENVMDGYQKKKMNNQEQTMSERSPLKYFVA